MSYSNRPIDETTATHGRGGEGNIDRHKHEDLSHRDQGAHPIGGTAERIDEGMGLGPNRSAGMGGGLEQHLHQLGLGRTDQDRTQMKDHGGLHDESDRTQPGYDPHAHRTGEGFGTDPRQHHGGDQHVHPGVEDTRRTHPAADNSAFTSTGRSGMDNTMMHGVGRKDQHSDFQHRTFPAGDGIDVTRSVGQGRTNDTTRTGTDMRDDENRHRTFPAEEGRDVMSTGSHRTGQVMDQGHNASDMRDDSDRHRTFPAGDDTNIPHRGRGGAGNVLSHEVKQVGLGGHRDDHTTRAHHGTRREDVDPRHEGLRRTDDRVLKGGEGHMPHGEGTAPHHGGKDDVTRRQHEGIRDHNDANRDNTTTGTTGHVGIGDKLRGTAEQLGGKLMGDPVREQKGIERKTGQLDDPGVGPTGVHNKRDDNF